MMILLDIIIYAKKYILFLKVTHFNIPQHFITDRKQIVNIKPIF